MFTNRTMFFRPYMPGSKRVLFPFYDTTVVEKQYERLIYDLPGFLSALGGSVGLYLGLSCVSVIYTFIDVASGMMQNDGNSREAIATKKIDVKS